MMVQRSQDDPRISSNNKFIKMQNLNKKIIEAIFQWKDRLKKKTDFDFEKELYPNKQSEFENELKSYDKGKKKIIVKGNSVFGINNIGNTCFFNSIMQCLNANRSLVNRYIENYENFESYAHLLPYNNINLRFSLFLESANSGEKSSINPKSFFKSLIAM